jgi:hypothetical protein
VVSRDIEIIGFDSIKVETLYFVVLCLSHFVHFTEVLGYGFEAEVLYFYACYWQNSLFGF